MKAILSFFDFCLFFFFKKAFLLFLCLPFLLRKRFFFLSFFMRKRFFFILAFF